MFNNLLRNLFLFISSIFNYFADTLIQINNTDSLRDLSISMISPIPLFEIIVAACCAKFKGHLDLKIFLEIPTSAAAVAAVNPNGIKTLLTNGVSILLIIGKPGFSDGPRILSRIISADE